MSDKKTAVYHTVSGDPALFHTSKTAKMISCITQSTLSECQRAA